MRIVSEGLELYPGLVHQPDKYLYHPAYLRWLDRLIQSPSEQSFQHRPFHPDCLRWVDGGVQLSYRCCQLEEGDHIVGDGVLTVRLPMTSERLQVYREYIQKVMTPMEYYSGGVVQLEDVGPTAVMEECQTVGRLGHMDYLKLSGTVIEHAESVGWLTMDETSAVQNMGESVQVCLGLHYAEDCRAPIVIFREGTLASGGMSYVCSVRVQHLLCTSWDTAEDERHPILSAGSGIQAELITAPSSADRGIVHYVREGDEWVEAVTLPPLRVVYLFPGMETMLSSRPEIIVVMKIHWEKDGLPDLLSSYLLYGEYHTDGGCLREYHLITSKSARSASRESRCLAAIDPGPEGLD